MAGVLFLASCLAGLTTSAAAVVVNPRQADTSTSNANVTLTPVTATDSSGSSAAAAALTPNVNVSLPYALSSDAAASALNIGLTTSHASVLLEAIPSVVAVDCAADSVSVTFDNADDLEAAYSQWSSHAVLVLVTNHMGDCDSELERGFFTADGFTTVASDLMLVATTQKSSISDIGSTLTTNFSGLPVAVSNSKFAKRGLGEVTYSPDPITFATDLVLNETTLFSVDDFSATLDSGSLDLSVTIGGFLTYNILTSTLVELEVYLETNTSSSLALDLAFNAAYNGTFAYTEAIETYTVDIPGILAFGPNMTFAIGAAVAADAGVDVLLTVGSAVDNGTFTLDYTGNVSVAGSGWKPTFDVSVSVSEAAAVAVTPYVASTFALDFAILGGAYNVSGGIVPSSEFPTDIALAASQGGASRRSDAIGSCAEGVSVESNFDFSLFAFVTGKWDEEYLYNVTVDVLDECITF